MMKLSLLALVVVSTAFFVACNGGDGEDASPTPSPTATETGTPTTSPTATPTAATSTPEPAVCLQAEQFSERGTLLREAGASGESLRVADLRWAAHEGCERFVIELNRNDEGAAAGTGALEVEFLRDQAAATDAEFSGQLAARAFVVRAADGALYVDLHLREAAQAAASLLTSPARVVIDLRPGGNELPPPAAIEGLTVLLEPRSGSSSYPLRIAGYARHFEANVVVRMVRDGTTLLQRQTNSTDWTEAWGAYELTLDDGPSGAVTLEVGDYSARDGTWEGVGVELSLP